RGAVLAAQDQVAALFEGGLHRQGGRDGAVALVGGLGGGEDDGASAEGEQAFQDHAGFLAGARGRRGGQRVRGGGGRGGAGRGAGGRRDESGPPRCSGRRRDGRERGPARRPPPSLTAGPRRSRRYGKGIRGEMQGEPAAAGAHTDRSSVRAIQARTASTST